jgi:hypothetical protein
MLRRMADLEDSDAIRGDAEAQSEATLMPWIWGGFGLLVIAIFVVWAFIGAPHATTRPPPAGPPIIKPLNPGY